MSVVTITGSARLHLETAVALVGKDQVLEWLHQITSAAPTTKISEESSTISLGSHVTSTSVTTVRKTASCSSKVADKAGVRGRKAGILPIADQRCSWTLNNGDQCSNKRKDSNSLCGLHIGKINLISPNQSPTADASVSGDDDE